MKILYALSMLCAATTVAHSEDDSIWKDIKQSAKPGYEMASIMVYEGRAHLSNNGVFDSMTECRKNGPDVLCFKVNPKMKKTVVWALRYFDEDSTQDSYAMLPTKELCMKLQTEVNEYVGLTKGRVSCYNYGKFDGPSVDEMMEMEDGE